LRSDVGMGVKQRPGCKLYSGSGPFPRGIWVLPFLEYFKEISDKKIKHPEGFGKSTHVVSVKLSRDSHVFSDSHKADFSTRFISIYQLKRWIIA
jgi:hypothetical protein